MYSAVLHVFLEIKLAYRISSGTTSQDVSGRFALSHQWDEEEPRLLVCEAKLLPRSGSSRISMPQPEPTSGMFSSRRASSSTMTMIVASDSDNNSKVSAKESEMSKHIHFETIKLL